MSKTPLSLHARFTAFMAGRYSAVVLAGLFLAFSALFAEPVHAASSILVVGAVAGTGSLDWLLTDHFDSEWVSEGVNNKNKLHAFFEEKSSKKEYNGKKVVYAHHTTRNNSPFFCAEVGYFAEADVQGGVDVTVDIRKMMSRVGPLTDDVIKDSASSDAAWEAVEENNFGKLVEDVARRKELVMGYTGSGVLARINAGTPSSSSTMGVDDPGGITGSVFGNRFLTKGIYVAAINPATGMMRAGVSKVLQTPGTSSGGNVVFESAPNAAWVDNDVLVKAANSSIADVLHTEYNKWPLGLLALFDDGTFKANFGGVDRTMVDNVCSYVQPSTGVLSVDGMQLMSDVLETRIGGVTSVMFSHSSVRRLVIKLTQADRRYADRDLMKPDPGTAAFKQGDITVGEVPIMAINDFPFGTLLGIDVEAAKMRRYVSSDGEWVKNNNGLWFPTGLGATAIDAKEAWYRCRYNNWAKNPAAAWRMDGITGATIPIVRRLGD